MTSLTLPELAGMLAETGATSSASECHGILCGALCVHRSYPAEQWLRDALAEDASAASAADFAPLVTETTAALRGDQMTFQPLLPEDSAPIGHRAAALGEWCAGFLYGLSTGALPKRIDTPEDVAEILQDFGEISRAVPDEADSDEENEAAYAELVEFVRVSAQLVHDELGFLRDTHAR